MTEEEFKLSIEASDEILSRISPEELDEIAKKFLISEGTIQTNGMLTWEDDIIDRNGNLATFNKK